MTIDLGTTKQSANFIESHISLPLYGLLNKSYPYHSKIYLIAPLVIFSDTLISLIQQVAFLVESACKGIFNFLAGVYIQNLERICLGITQITVGALTTLFSPIFIFYREVCLTNGIHLNGFHEEIKQQIENFSRKKEIPAIELLTRPILNKEEYVEENS